MLNIDAHDNRIILSESGYLLKDAWENCVFTLLLFSLLSDFLNIFGEHIHQVINDISCKNFDRVLFGVLLSVVKNLNVKDEQTAISDLE